MNVRMTTSSLYFTIIPLRIMHFSNNYYNILDSINVEKTPAICMTGVFFMFIQE